MTAEQKSLLELYLTFRQKFQEIYKNTPIDLVQTLDEISEHIRNTEPKK